MESMGRYMWDFCKWFKRDFPPVWIFIWQESYVFPAARIWVWSGQKSNVQKILYKVLEKPIESVNGLVLTKQ